MSDIPFKQLTWRQFKDGFADYHDWIKVTNHHELYNTKAINDVNLYDDLRIEVMLFLQNTTGRFYLDIMSYWFENADDAMKYKMIITP